MRQTFCRHMKLYFMFFCDFISFKKYGLYIDCLAYTILFGILSAMFRFAWYTKEPAMCFVHVRQSEQIHI